MGHFRTKNATKALSLGIVFEETDSYPRSPQHRPLLQYLCSMTRLKPQSPLRGATWSFANRFDSGTFVATLKELRGHTSPGFALGPSHLYIARSRTLGLHHHRSSLGESLPLVEMEEDQDAIRNTSFGKAVYSILCAMIGAGILGLPGTLAATNLYGLLVMAAMGAVLHYSGVMCYCCDCSRRCGAQVGGK